MGAFDFALAAIFPEVDFVGLHYFLIFMKMLPCRQNSSDWAQILVTNSRKFVTFFKILFIGPFSIFFQTWAPKGR